jgi:FMN phosphatase YigB (HAD superfamily)
MGVRLRTIPKLISLDVGGTVGRAEGKSIAMLLVQASPLTPVEVRQILREKLHVLESLSAERISLVCNALHIDASVFPTDHVPPRFIPYAGAVAAIESLSRLATVVTLSNVCCLDYDALAMERMLGRHVAAQYPSCVLGHSKPNERAFSTVAARHGATPDSLLHIGDDWDCDVIGGLNAGAQVVWLTRGDSNPPSDVRGCDRLTVARNLPDAAQKVREIMALA